MRVLHTFVSELGLILIEGQILVSVRDNVSFRLEAKLDFEFRRVLV